MRNILQAVGVAISNIDNVPFKLNALLLDVCGSEIMRMSSRWNGIVQCSSHYYYYFSFSLSLSFSLSFSSPPPPPCLFLFGQNLFCTQQELTAQITAHYVSQGIREVYKVFGCLDVIGNPMKLFGHIGDGLTDLFYEPLQADDKLLALGRGAKSLGSHMIAGTAGAVTSITSTIGNSFAVLSMDAEYQRDRATARNAKKTALGRLGSGGLVPHISKHLIRQIK